MTANRIEPYLRETFDTLRHEVAASPHLALGSAHQDMQRYSESVERWIGWAWAPPADWVARGGVRQTVESCWARVATTFELYCEACVREASYLAIVNSDAYRIEIERKLGKEIL